MSELKTTKVTIQSTEQGEGKGQYAGSNFTILHTDELQGGVFLGPKPLQDHIANKRQGDQVELVYRANSKNTGWIGVNIDGILQKKPWSGSGGGGFKKGNGAGNRWANEEKVFGMPKSMVVAWVKDLVVAGKSVEKGIATIKEISDGLDAEK